MLTPALALYIWTYKTTHYRLVDSFSLAVSVSLWALTSWICSLSYFLYLTNTRFRFLKFKKNTAKLYAIFWHLFFLHNTVVTQVLHTSSYDSFIFSCCGIVHYNNTPQSNPFVHGHWAVLCDQTQVTTRGKMTWKYRDINSPRANSPTWDRKREAMSFSSSLSPCRRPEKSHW